MKSTIPSKSTKSACEDNILHLAQPTHMIIEYATIHMQNWPCFIKTYLGASNYSIKIWDIIIILQMAQQVVPISRRFCLDYIYILYIYLFLCIFIYIYNFACSVWIAINQQYSHGFHIYRTDMWPYNYTYSAKPLLQIQITF